MVAPAYSPPVEKPCTIFNRYSGMIAHSPICADVGRMPMSAVAVAIIAIVRKSTFCRPMRSPRGPSTKPPKGRTRKEIAKPSRVTSRPQGAGTSDAKTTVSVTARYP